MIRRTNISIIILTRSIILDNEGRHSFDLATPWRENREQRHARCQGSLEGEQIAKLGWSSIADERGHKQRPCARRSFSFERKRERERSACAQTSAGCYENSNEICVSYVGDHWLVPHTSLTHSLSRPSPLMLGVSLETNRV